STVTTTRSAGAGTLLGTTNLAAVGGIVTFTNLAHPLVTNITIQFTSTGRTGTPTTQYAGTNFTVKIMAVDATWNLLTNVTDTVGLTSSDPNAALPAT